ncbi:MAG TPA: class I adenylate-forming enzyme family protein [Actinocrinis sp.]|nr:class I adenylate-forming enzyme family protein [Actinocrinis sp.]
MLVSDLFERSRISRAEHRAVTDEDGSLTYRELGDLVDRAAGWLRGHGVGVGDRVVHAGGNDRSFLALFYATLRLGAVFVPVHPELTDAQIDGIVENCSAALAVCSPAAGARAGHTAIVARAWQEITATDPDPSAARIGPDNLAMLIYTSGTTGRPKGVMCPHRQMLAAVESINSRLGYQPQDVVLCRVPLSFDYGLYQALFCALTGATLVLAQRRRDTGLLKLIVEHQVTVIPLVPSLAQILTVLQRKHRVQAKVRLFTNTGARPGREIMAELLSLFPGSVFASMYGMTECKRISILDPAEYAAYPDSVGPAIPGDAIRIVDAAKQPVGPGVTGEIVVGGTTVMAGYWGVAPQDQQRFLPGADGSLELHTGDQGRLDADGRLYFVGRDDDVIKRRGIRMGLTEIEDAAERIPGLTAAVALKPEPEDGPLVLAVCTALTEDQVRAHLRGLLDPARIPDLIVRIAEVPLTGNGKPDRPAVRRLLAAGTTAAEPRTLPLPETRTIHEPVGV